MPRFGNLKINTKFNLIISLLLVSLFLVAAYLTYERQQVLILKIAEDNARIIARQIIETRDYISSVVHGEPDQNYNLVPQVVATHVAERITRGSNYYVRQVSLRYRNPKTARACLEKTSSNSLKTGNRSGWSWQPVSVKGKRMAFERQPTTRSGVSRDGRSLWRCRFPPPARIRTRCLRRSCGKSRKVHNSLI